MQNVGVVEGGGGDSLAAEALPSLDVPGEGLGEDLYCDGPSEAGVAGAVDLAEAARADPLEDLELGDDGPRERSRSFRPGGRRSG